MNDKLVMEELFYSKPFFFSYSGINKLLSSPRSFYNYYILGQRDQEITTAMTEGRIIHSLLLDPRNFKNQFVIAQASPPSASAQEIIDNIFKIYSQDLPGEEVVVRTQLDQYEDEVLSLMSEKSFHDNVKDKKLKAAKIINDKGTEYFEFLKSSQNKILISETTYARCVDIVEKIKIHSVYEKYLGLTGSSDRKIYNEIKVELTQENFPFGLKGIIDNLNIDIHNKTIYINDLKTTSKPITEFSETVQHHKYWIQASLYERLVRYHLKLDESWNSIFTFIVIDKHDQIYPFEVSEPTMTTWQTDFQDVLKMVSYHYSRRGYTLPYIFLTSKITL